MSKNFNGIDLLTKHGREILDKYDFDVNKLNDSSFNSYIDSILEECLSEKMLNKLDRIGIRNLVKINNIINGTENITWSDFIILSFLELGTEWQNYQQQLNSLLNEILFTKFEERVEEYVDLKSDFEDKIYRECDFSESDIDKILYHKEWIETQIEIFKNQDKFIQDNNLLPNKFEIECAKKLLINNLKNKLSMLIFHNNAFAIMLNKVQEQLINFA